jgi:hypothetical protein
MFISVHGSKLPLVFNSLDDKAERRADAIHILVHDLLDDGRLSRIIQPPSQQSVRQTVVSGLSNSQHQYSHFLIFQPRFSQY